MTRQKIILAVMALLMMGGASGLLVWMKAKQRLGEPGVKTMPIAGSHNLKVMLPSDVLSYKSEELEQSEIVTNVLPADTSYGQRRYTNRENPNDWLLLNVVLMGADRTSLHKPQYCLEGAGWKIDHPATVETKVAMDRPRSYELPVIKIISTRDIMDANGQTMTVRGLYVYWFVADGALSGDKSGSERMWSMAKNLLKKGELQRWAYISCFAVCLPGKEDETFERVKKFMVAAVPEFQLVPRPNDSVASAKQ
jgi:hypothetical protein